MVNLADRERTQRASREPEFFRKASNASDAQAKWFQIQLGDSRTIALCSEAAGKLTGFVIAVLTPAPPVYDPGGLTSLIHDFVLDDPEQWTTFGIELIDEVSTQAKANGAVQMVVVCTLADETKRAFLANWGRESFRSGISGDCESGVVWNCHRKLSNLKLDGSQLCDGTESRPTGNQPQPMKETKSTMLPGEKRGVFTESWIRTLVLEAMRTGSFGDYGTRIVPKESADV